MFFVDLRRRPCVHAFETYDELPRLRSADRSRTLPSADGHAVGTTSIAREDRFTGVRIRVARFKKK